MRVVAGRFRGKTLHTPPDGSIRPTSDRVREAVFSSLSSRLGPDLGGAQVLDLFAGTGAMGIEALSRGASHCAFVDNGIAARAVLRENTQAFGIAGQMKMLKRDATDLGPRQRIEPADLVFLDPPYGKGLGEKALIAARDGDWLAPGAIVVFEEAKSAAVEISEGFDLLDERHYGDTTIRYLEFVGG